MKEKWGDEAARDVWKTVTNMSLQKGACSWRAGRKAP